MQKRMGEAVARVARKVNDTVENKTDSLDLANCKLMTFPVGIYKAMRSVTEGIHRISLANNELKSITSRFVTTFSQLRELNLAGNYLHRLPEEITSLLHLRAINLSRNRFRRFPEPLATVPSLETIDLEENEIAAAHFLCRGADGEVGVHGIAAEPQPAGQPRGPRGASAGPAPRPLRSAAVTRGARPRSLTGSRGARASCPEGRLPTRVVWLRSVPATPLFLSQTRGEAASPSVFLN
ncbi:leucine-rich repeat-containing protein 20 isoform X1 [Empidonax traillii]|uniref:leucine-rich repeat-containing protein 20 isoform X1 n=1 Tax=Empidonax traillii TaxID=164674 RepID=UPI000FFCF7E8|nr:leucine-rich repeat-containing protein 20 isoform X1 [Empidonax traillii]